jgi:hypothetical protein
MAIGLALVAVIAGIVATLITGGSFFPVAPATPSIPPTVIAPLPSPPAAIDSAQVDVPPTSPGAVSVLTPDGEVVEPTTPAAAIPPTTPAATPPPRRSREPTGRDRAWRDPHRDRARTRQRCQPDAGDATRRGHAGRGHARSGPAGGCRARAGGRSARRFVERGRAVPRVRRRLRKSRQRRAPGPDLPGSRLPGLHGYAGRADDRARRPLRHRGRGEPGRGADHRRRLRRGSRRVPVPPRCGHARRVHTDTGGAGRCARARLHAPRRHAAPPTRPPRPSRRPSPPRPPRPRPPCRAAAPAAIQTASSGRSLQVGAFADATSAAPLRERLASLGLVAFEVREDGLIKLLVGPFEAARLTEVRRQLAAVGIESFPR